MGYKRLSRTQLTFIGVTELLIAVYATYHVTHNGLTSGSFELVAFTLLALALFLPQRTARSYHGMSPLQLAFIGIVACMVLIFGIYHLSTPDGKRSGTLELISLTLLALAIFLPRKPQDR